MRFRQAWPAPSPPPHWQASDWSMPHRKPIHATAPSTLRIIVASSREDAQRLVERVTQGEDFAALARSRVDRSDAPGTAACSDGLQLSSLRPESAKRTAAASRAGQVTAIAPVPTGFAFMRVEANSMSASAAPTTTAGSVALLATGSVKYVHRRRRPARSGSGSSRVPEAGRLGAGSAHDLPGAR